MQRRELGAWAERAGHTVVKFYEDQGIVEVTTHPARCWLDSSAGGRHLRVIRTRVHPPIIY